MERLPAVALWPLPAICAIVPIAAAHIAYALSVQAGHVPECLTYLEGCTSISRAARHGLGNHVFRALMLPCALVQAMVWFATRRWLRGRSPDPTAGRSLLALGAIAGVAMGVYVTFLGTDGDVYRWMRSYGVKFYFAASYLALLVVLRNLRDVHPPHPGLRRALLVIALAFLALGLASTAVTGLASDEDLKARLENVMEWHLGLLLSAAFAVLALLWHRTGFRMHL